MQKKLPSTPVRAYKNKSSTPIAQGERSTVINIDQYAVSKCLVSLYNSSELEPCVFNK